MRILLDEDLPRRLGALLVGHEASTVQRSGWSGIKNGELLALAAARFDVFLTMDGNLEFQQNLATLPIAVLVVEAVSNRMEYLLPQLPSGKLRVLATTGAQRSKFMPNIPTMLESGYKDVVVEVRLGVFMPAHTPPAVVARAAAAINEALRLPDLRETFSKFGLEPLQGSPESFAALVKSDLAAWGPVIKASGFTAED